MFGRRFLIIVAVLMGLMALAASVAPRQPVRDDGDATPTPAPAGTPNLTAVEKTLTTSEGDTRVTVNEGDRVELTVSGDERGSVKVLGRIDAIHPSTPARLSLLARRAGEHPIELLEEDRRIGTLVVRESG